MNKEEKRALEELLHDLKEHNLHYALSYEDKCYEAIVKLQQELERYKNIIDELEKWLDENWNKPLAQIYVADVVEKINELKRSDN